METTTSATEPPITSQQAPDFGEPWQDGDTSGSILGAGFHNILTENDFDRHSFLEWASLNYHLRAIQSVNACAGMADPAKDIQALRDKLDDKTVMHLPLLEKLAAAEKRIRDLHETVQGIESDARDLRKFKKFPESVESLACSILLKLKPQPHLPAK